MQKMIMLLALASLIACRPVEPASRKVNLTIYGYNYTNKYIDQVYVDGIGGGNLYLAFPGGGGGKSACCMVWDPTRQLPKRYTVRWVDGGCKKPAFEEDGRPVMSADGRQMFSIRHYFAERVVDFDGPVESNPHYFEVHIYPDHVVKIKVTEFPSLPDSKDIPDPASEVPSNVPCPNE